MSTKIDQAMNVIAGLLFVIDWLGDYVEDSDNHIDHVEYLYGKKWLTEFFPMRNSAHCGDCTSVPMACVRCQVDEYFRKAQGLLSSVSEK